MKMESGVYNTRCWSWLMGTVEKPGPGRVETASRQFVIRARLMLDQPESVRC